MGKCRGVYSCTKNNIYVHIELAKNEVNKLPLTPVRLMTS